MHDDPIVRQQNFARDLAVGRLAIIPERADPQARQGDERRDDRADPGRSGRSLPRLSSPIAARHEAVFCCRTRNSLCVRMLPISLRPNGRRVVIVGGGNVAARKAKSIAAAGFPIFVVSERVGRSYAFDLERERRHVRSSARTRPRDLQNASLVVAATDDPELNARIVADARAAHALVCDAAVPDRGDFTMAATQRIGELTISVDSGGSAPAFSRRVVAELAERLGAPYADAVRTLARMRAYVKDAFPEEERGGDSSRARCNVRFPSSQRRL